MQTLAPFISILIIFALIVKFFMLYNSTLINISDHEHEYGILRSLGFSKCKIYKQIISENLVFTSISVLIAVILIPYTGAWMVSLFEEQFALFTAFPDWLYLLAVSLPICVVLYAGKSGLKYIYRRDLYEQVQSMVL